MGFPTKNDHFGVFWDTTIYGNTHLLNKQMLHKYRTCIIVIRKGHWEPNFQDHLALEKTGTKKATDVKFVVW